MHNLRFTEANFPDKNSRCDRDGSKKMEEIILLLTMIIPTSRQKEDPTRSGNKEFKTPSTFNYFEYQLRQKLNSSAPLNVHRLEYGA